MLDEPGATSMRLTPAGSVLTSATPVASTLPTFITFTTKLTTPLAMTGLGTTDTLAATSRPLVTVPPQVPLQTWTPIAVELLPGAASGPSEVTDATSTASPAAAGAFAHTTIVVEPPAVSTPIGHRPSASGYGDALTKVAPVGS